MRAAVLGSPVAHSLSPVLHRAAYAHLGLRWRYDAIECAEGQLAGFVASLTSDWVGLSLTMPLKAAVLPLADDVDEDSRRAAAANTLVLHEGRRHAANTDVPGMVAALAEQGVAPADESARAAVLGSGATARSAVVSLSRAGWRRVEVVARRPSAAADLVDVGSALGVVVTVVDWADAAGALARPLVVATVPRGATDRLAADVPPSPGVLFDVLYHPWPTPLAATWAAAGGQVVGGLDLLVHQAAQQVRLMTRLDVPADELVAVMRPAGRAVLAARAR